MIDLQAQDVRAQARTQWIEDRINEFEADSRARDRAIATVLYEIMMAGETLRKMSALVDEGGLGGILGGLFGGKKNGKAKA